MTFLFGNFYSTRILSVTGGIRRGEPEGQAGVSPAVYSPGGKLPGGPTARMVVLFLL
jgi:hypothetical protein